MSEECQCRPGKRGYPTEKQAKAAARKLRKGTVDWFRVNHYFCPVHRIWQVGNRPISLRR